MDETNEAGVTGESGDNSAELDMAALLGEGGQLDGEQGEQGLDEQAKGESGEDGDAENQEEKADPETATHKLDNGREVTLRELKQSFQDFNQKSARIDQERRATLEQARNAVAEISEKNARQVEILSQQVMQFVAPGIDENTLARLAIEDPAQYHAARVRLDAAQRLQQNMNAYASQLAQQAQQQRTQAQQEAAQAHQQLLDSESSRLRAHKWWNAEFASRATNYAAKHGIPKEVTERVAHAGFVEITRKAMMYDDAMAKTKSGKQLPSQPMIKPGTTGKVNDVKQLRGLMDRAHKTNDVTDIGHALMKIL